MTFNFAALPTLLSKIFPSQVRYTGLGFAYNLANAVLGGSAPLFALYLIQLTGSSVAPAFFMMALGAITLIPFLFKDPVIQEIR
jgi:MHS family proline/betaine transporter-like MFS transporter